MELQPLDLDIAADTNGAVSVVMTATIPDLGEGILSDLYVLRSEDYGHTWGMQVGLADTTGMVRLYSPRVSTGRYESCIAWTELRPEHPNDLYRLMVAYLLPGGELTAPVRVDGGNRGGAGPFRIRSLRAWEGGYMLVYDVEGSGWAAVASETRHTWKPIAMPVAGDEASAAWSSESGPSVAVCQRSRAFDVYVRSDIGTSWTVGGRVLDVLGAGESLVDVHIAESRGTLALATTIHDADTARIELRTSDDLGKTWTAPQLLAEYGETGTPILWDLDTDGGRWHVAYFCWSGPYSVDLYWRAGIDGAWTQPRQVNADRGTALEQRVASLDVQRDEAYVTWLRTSPYNAAAPRFRSTDQRSVPGFDPSALLYVDTTPNPMRSDGARLTLDLVESASVLVELYSVAGRLQLRRELGRLDSGRHTLWWDGKNDRRRALSPGVYFWRVKGIHGTSTMETTAKLVVR